MKLILGQGEEMDLRGRKFVLAVADGTEAEVRMEGTGREVGQLVDAVLRAALDEKGTQQIC